ncbi:MAG: alkaline phosphatase family protein [Micropruina sp.]|uniref:alkaline phosphatase family protein n=1 Tax=Micropruina sp. TaxID=2737536 RepID=UPI0039E62109
MSEHVLIVGIDGVRYDALGEEPTPHLDALAARGFLTPVQVNDAGPTISGPCWATILSGALADRHLIRDNDLSPNALDAHPDVLRLAAVQRPRTARFAGAGWAPIVDAVSGGPLLADRGFFPPGDQAHLPDEWQVADQAVTDATVAFLDDHDGRDGSLVFCYLGGVDETGHLLGVGDEYRGFVRDSDTRLGELLAALDRRPSTEDWTVIVVTDHGHVDAGGHGGESDAERTAWIAAAGPGIPENSTLDAETVGDTPLKNNRVGDFRVRPGRVEQADVAGHTMHVLGLTPPPGTFGVRFGAR